MASLKDIRNEIKLKLTGDLLEIELEDETIDKVINRADINNSDSVDMPDFTGSIE